MKLILLLEALGKSFGELNNLLKVFLVTFGELWPQVIKSHFNSAFLRRAAPSVSD
jgi:hypothetical protein